MTVKAITMMFIVLLALVSFVKAVPAPGRGALKGYCNTDEHCKRKQCCVSFVLPGQPRTDPDGSVTRFVDGKCERYQPRNSACLIPGSNVTTTDLHYLYCPCHKKYTCVPNGKTSSVGQFGECRPRCRSVSDCAKDECCVVSGPGGRGGVAGDRGRRRGVCQPMGIEGAVCLMMNGSGRPSGLVSHSCPCLKPYNCGNLVTIDPTRVATCGFFKG